jgi:hypothetical protein
LVYLSSTELRKFPEERVHQGLVAGLFLSDGGTVERVAVRRNIVYANGHDITPAQLAVDCEIEKCQVACALCDLELGPD